MKQEFWFERWHNNKIGFHQQTVNPYLQRHWSRMQLQPGTRVLVPCCGKSLDLLWLKDQGFDVQGVEISPVAVEAFFAENNLHPDISEWETCTISAIDNLQLVCGDFFKLTAADVEGVEAVYDRAAMIAMPAEMRLAYCRHLQTITHKKVPILLVTLEYPQDEMQGPPFSVTEAEVQANYAQDYTVSVLENEDILANDVFFQEKGLSRLQERIYLLTPHR
jgi:thiopurine S-methyltransferase